MDAELVTRILEPWHINHRVNEMLLDAISPEGFKCTLSKRGGRDVGRQFAHLHDVRFWHLDSTARRYAKGMTRIDPKGPIDRALLKRQLARSTEAIAAWPTETLAADGSVKPVKSTTAVRTATVRTAIVRLAYFIAHESHHRGSILLTLKQCGHKVPQDVAWAIWDWGKL